jgi:hypothetical protein
MAYSGTSVPIVLGTAGLVTDDPISSLPLNALEKANNVSFQNGRISKQQGSLRFNSSALSSAIVALTDWWPTSALQRLIAMTADGKMWRDTGDTSFTGTTPIKTGLGALSTDARFVTGGQESAGKNKKLFGLTGISQIQVLSGDSATPTDISMPSPDWATGNFPTFGIQYQGRLVVMNSASNRHQIYFSTLQDHENFTGTVFGSTKWELWQRIAATPNVNETTAIQAGTASTLFTITNSDGYIVYGARPFNKFTLNITQIQAGSPVYTYEYWNGSAWVALPLSTTPSYSTLGSTSAEFAIPSAWAVGDGTETGGNNSYYAVRVLATTAPTQAVKANSLQVINTTFDAAPPTFSVFPGEGDGVMTAAVYRGVLFIIKKPFGVYVLNGSDPLPINWTLTKYADSFGVSSPHSILQILGDLAVANSNGSVTSLQASNAFGDFDAGDILKNAKVEEYIRKQLDYTGLPFTQAIYYPEKKIAMFTGQSSTNPVRDRILAIDVAKTAPRIYLINKDNPNCLSLRKDPNGISRPMYGDQNGFVYLMDQQTYNVNGTPYLGEFQTAYTDFGQVDPTLSSKNKIFDFLEVNYVPTGNNSFFCDVYVDGAFRQTLAFYQSFGIALDIFQLDKDILAGDPTGNRNRKPLQSCTGNKISFRFYNNNSNEAFQIERIIVSFRISAEQIYSGQV